MNRRLLFAWPLFLIVPVFFLSSRIHAALIHDQPSLGLEDPWDRMLGSAKEAIGDTLFLKADSYFHGGVNLDFHEEDPHPGPAAPPEETPAPGEILERPGDWIARVNSRVQSHEHRHLSRNQFKEMLPFLAMAVNLDPHNVEAVLTTAYWIGTQFDNTEEALKVLVKGREDNPANWEISRALGEIYLRKKEDPASAERFYTEALGKAGSGEVKKYQLIDLYYRLGESLRRQNKKDEALEAYGRALAVFGPEGNEPLKREILQEIRLLKGDADR